MKLRLDSVKGIAILLIVAFHVSALPLNILPQSSVYSRLVLPKRTPSVSDLIAPFLDLNDLILGLPGIVSSLGYQGAHVFIIASGLGLTLSFLKKGIQLRQWYLRRAQRVLPTYWLSLIVLIVFFLYFPYTTTTRLLTTFVLQVLCLHVLVPGFFYGFLFNNPQWFVGLLFQLYLFFPALIKLFKRWSPLQIFLLSVLVTAVFRLIGLYYVDQYHPQFSAGAVFLCRLAEFVFGMTFAYHLASRPQNWIGYLSKLAVPLYLCGILLHCSKPTNALSDTVIGISLFLLLWTMVRYLPSPVLKGLAFWGRHSLGIFIFHSLLLWPAYALIIHIGIGTESTYLFFLCQFLICLTASTIIDIGVARVQGAVSNHFSRNASNP